MGVACADTIATLVEQAAFNKEAQSTINNSKKDFLEAQQNYKDNPSEENKNNVKIKAIAYKTAIEESRVTCKEQSGLTKECISENSLTTLNSVATVTSVPTKVGGLGDTVAKVLVEEGGLSKEFVSKVIEETTPGSDLKEVGYIQE